MVDYLLTAVAEVSPKLGETVDIINKSGLETVLSAVVVMALVAGVGIFAWWIRRKLSGDYIHKDEVLNYVKEKHPSRVKPPITELADLRTHDAFDMWDREIRTCDSIQIRDNNGNVDYTKSALAKDIIQWTIRAHRNTFKKMLDESYNLVSKSPESFEDYYGDPKGFQHKINNAYTQIKAAISYKIKDDLKMPLIVFDNFEQYRSEIQETMRDMLQIAVTNHTNNYWRMHEVLNSQYAFTRTLRASVITFLKCYCPDISNITYTSVTDGTLQNLKPKIEIGSASGPHNTAEAIFNYD